jgi:ferrous iron transport protein A
MPSHRLTLLSLVPGEEALVAAIHAGELLQQRLRALGFRTGQRVRLMRQAAFHGPLHVRVGTTDVIIRRKEAVHIELRLP